MERLWHEGLKLDVGIEGQKMIKGRRRRRQKRTRRRRTQRRRRRGRRRKRRGRKWRKKEKKVKKNKDEDEEDDKQKEDLRRKRARVQGRLVSLKKKILFFLDAQVYLGGWWWLSDCNMSKWYRSVGNECHHLLVSCQVIRATILLICRQSVISLSLCHKSSATCYFFPRSSLPYHVIGHHQPVSLSPVITSAWERTNSHRQLVS